MRIKSFSPSLIMPTLSTAGAVGFDIYMPTDGSVDHITQKVGLGFGAEIPPGYCAFLLPRSSVGAKHGLELNNTAGLIDPDYRGEWFAFMRTKNGKVFQWNQGDRVLQFVLVPVFLPSLELVDDLGTTLRAEGGIGSTGT